MITLDTATLRFRALNIQGCYMTGIDNHNIKEVLLDGKGNHHVFYCDVNSGFAIVYKQDLNGKIVVSDNELIHDIFFGKVEVIFDDMEKPAD